LNFPDATMMTFDDAVRGFIAGDFTRLAPLCEVGSDEASSIVAQWHAAGLFASEPQALEEAFTCACFNGALVTVTYLLAQGVNPNGGINTGMNAFHWAANRGQLGVVRVLIDAGAALDAQNMYGGTVRGCTEWSAVHEPKPEHREILEALIAAGAQPTT
jgi:hypothetical protein